jgi:hypothetical protein
MTAYLRPPFVATGGNRRGRFIVNLSESRVRRKKNRSPAISLFDMFHLIE